ncbi:sulfatase, partial [Candidatus Latescibacterota bacterium]
DAIKHMTIASAGAMLSRCAPSPKLNRRPNILFIMTDDQTVDQMSCYGHPFLKTPNMDRIASEGTKFTNCFCTNSLCAPSRATVLNGCYSSISGVKTNSYPMAGEPEKLNPDMPTFPELLREAGYQTGLMGKYHIKQDPKGFDEWRILPGQGVYFDPVFIENGENNQYKGYVTDIITDKALDYLERRDKDRPFCLVYQHKAPHRPFTPAPRHAKLWEDMEIPYPVTFNDKYETRRAAKIATDMKLDVNLLGDYAADIKGMTEEETKKWIYQRFVKDSNRAVVGVDENLGRVFEYLDSEGITDDTLIMYTSDNGFNLGDHGWYDKRFMYEPSLRLPLVIRYPRFGSPGQVSDSFVQNTDFAPTILDIAGLPVPDSMHGRSFKQILEGNTPMDWRKTIYYHYYENYWLSVGPGREAMEDPNLDYQALRNKIPGFTRSIHRVLPHRGVRNDRYKLIEYYTERDGYMEFFDLKTDPHELRNVYGNPVYKEIIDSMTRELTQLKKQYDGA